MLYELLGSKARAAILSALMTEPGRSIHLRELVRCAGGSVSGVQREIERLQGIGLVRSVMSEQGRREISLVVEHPFADGLAGLVAADGRVAYAPVGPGVANAATSAGLLNPHIRGLASSIVDAALEFGVLRVALFGSSTENDVAIVPHDLDVSVRFDPQDRRSRADLFFGLRVSLQEATSMPIDLLEIDSVDNPYMLRELAESEMVLYEAT